MIERMTLVGHLAAYFAITTLVACAAHVPTVNEKLDPLTAVSITYVDTPILLYRNVPSMTSKELDYLHVGPILVNRGGTYTYFLWFSLWTAVPTFDPAEHHDGFESAALVLDGEPLFLDLAGWTSASIGVSERVYGKKYESSKEAYYRVTPDQIRLITEAVDIRLHTADSPAKEFVLWDDQVAAREDLAEFLIRASL